MRDSQLNVKVNSGCWPASIHVDIDEDSPLMFNDFNIFSLPLCNLSMAKKVLLSKKKLKCSAVL